MVIIEYSVFIIGELYEFKGIVIVDVNMVYVVDGVGFGVWCISFNVFCNYVSVIGIIIVVFIMFIFINLIIFIIGILREFFYNSVGRLIYIGINLMIFCVYVQFGFQYIGGGFGVVDIIVFKNSLFIGVFCFIIVLGFNGVFYLFGFNQFDLVINDYVEVYV